MRSRGSTLRQPLLVRLLGGAGPDAAVLGAGGGVAFPCQRSRRVHAEVVDDDAVSPVREHGGPPPERAGPAGCGAGRRRDQADRGGSVTVPVGVDPCGAVGARLRGAGRRPGAWAGHRIDGRCWLARAGGLERRRDCMAAEGIIGWTVRQTFFQRRAGVATLIAATATGEALSGDRRSRRAGLAIRGRRQAGPENQGRARNRAMIIDGRTSPTRDDRGTELAGSWRR
jgi:putative membrane protein